MTGEATCGLPFGVTVTACYDEDHVLDLLLVVRDEGSTFDPDAVPDPTASECIYSAHGRGIYLMRQVMDGVEFRNGGREVEAWQAREVWVPVVTTYRSLRRG